VSPPALIIPVRVTLPKPGIGVTLQVLPLLICGYPPAVRTKPARVHGIPIVKRSPGFRIAFIIAVPAVRTSGQACPYTAVGNVGYLRAVVVGSGFKVFCYPQIIADYHGMVYISVNIRDGSDFRCLSPE
jgi:hypothetical protein